MSSQAYSEQSRPHEVYEQISYQTGPTLTRGEDCTICLEQIKADTEALTHDNGLCLNAWHIACLEAELQASEMRVGHARCPNCRTTLSAVPASSQPGSRPSTPPVPTNIVLSVPNVPPPDQDRTRIQDAHLRYSRQPNFVRIPSFGSDDETDNESDSEDEADSESYDRDEYLLSDGGRNERYMSVELETIRRISEEGQDEDIVEAWRRAHRTANTITSRSADPVFYARVDFELRDALDQALEAQSDILSDIADVGAQRLTLAAEENLVSYHSTLRQALDRARAAIARDHQIQRQLQTNDATLNIGPDPYEEVDLLWRNEVTHGLTSHSRAIELMSYWDIFDHRLLMVWWHHQRIADRHISNVTNPSVSRELADQLRRTLTRTNVIDRANRLLLRTQPIHRTSIEFVLPTSRFEIESSDLQDSDVLFHVYNVNFDDYSQLLQRQVTNSWARARQGGSMSPYEDDEDAHERDSDNREADQEAEFVRRMGYTYVENESDDSQPAIRDPEVDAQLDAWLDTIGTARYYPARVARLREEWYTCDHALLRMWYGYQIEGDDMTMYEEDFDFGLDLEDALYSSLIRADIVLQANSNLPRPLNRNQLSFVNPGRRDILRANWSDDDTLLYVWWQNYEDLEAQMQGHMRRTREDLSRQEASDQESS